MKFKVMVKRMLKEFDENYKELCGNNINMKNHIETMKKNQLEMKNQYLKLRVHENQLKAG